MVFVLAGVQLATPGVGMPPVLWLLFSAVWAFGAAMLWWVPVFGAIGTAVYGVLLVFLLQRAHGLGGLNALIGIGSVVGSVLAVAFLVERLRARR